MADSKRYVGVNLPWKMWVALSTDAYRRGETITEAVRRHLERSLADGIAPDLAHRPVEAKTKPSGLIPRRYV